MREVAKHLSTHAMTNYTDGAAELFIKSACNRYYYYVYLTLRDEAYNLLDRTIKFEHGSKCAKAINGTYKQSIKRKLDISDSEIFEALVSDLIKRFTTLYDIREEADYSAPTVTITSSDAKINFHKKSKNHEYFLSDIENRVDEIVHIINLLSSYRIMAGC